MVSKIVIDNALIYELLNNLYTNFKLYIDYSRYNLDGIANTQKYFPILVESNRILTVITLFPLICHQIDFRLVPNQSEKCNDNPNLMQYYIYIYFGILN